MHSLRTTLAISLFASVVSLSPFVAIAQDASPSAFQEGLAELTVNLVRKSDRSSVIAGTYEDGKTCSGFKYLGIEGDKVPTYTMRVPAKVFAVYIFSAKAEGGVFSPGGAKGSTCGGIYTFTPQAGTRYVLTFLDEASSCVAQLQEVKEGQPSGNSVPLVARKYSRPFFGSRFCEEEYVPGNR